MNVALDFQNHFAQKDIDTRISKSRDDIMQVMQLEHRSLDTKIDTFYRMLDAKIDANTKMLNEKIDFNTQILNAKIDAIDKRIDKVESRIDKLHVEMISMKKWAIGMFITVLLAIALLAIPIIMLYLLS